MLSQRAQIERARVGAPLIEIGINATIIVYRGTPTYDRRVNDASPNRKETIIESKEEK